MAESELLPRTDLNASDEPSSANASPEIVVRLQTQLSAKDHAVPRPLSDFFHGEGSGSRRDFFHGEGSGSRPAPGVRGAGTGAAAASAAHLLTHGRVKTHKNTIAATADARKANK
jgi:hypothetical protein